MKMKFVLLLNFLMLFFAREISAQLPPKTVNTQTQTWFGFITQTKLHNHWSVLADMHIRRNHFAKDPSFLIIRAALACQLTEHFTVAAGYGHMWLAPSTQGWKTMSNEHRIYQQFQWQFKIRHIALQQRIRNEQRWQQKIANDKRTGSWRFTDRIRYLLSATIPVFKNPCLPSLVVAEELCIHYGKEVVYNRFDQNRFFIGIKQKVSPRLNFDIGYMRVYQKKFSGYQYDLNNTLRLFFFYTSAWKKK